MTKGITGQEPDARVVYADIIDLPHPVSKRHPRMPLYDRAAQFAPFAALTGYEDMISEEARLTEEKIELGEDALERLNQRLAAVSDRVAEGEQPLCAITYFVPDPIKSGGAYTTLTEAVRRVDPIARRLILNRPEGRSGANMEIAIEQILELELIK